MCLLCGLDTGVVDYDARERNAAHETGPVRFRQAMESAIERLSALGKEELARPIRMRVVERRVPCVR